jgi:hypothetical protein
MQKNRERYKEEKKRNLIFLAVLGTLLTFFPPIAFRC